MFRLMAKQITETRVTPKSNEVEVPFTVMRKIGPERYEVVSGVVKGVPSDIKTLERNVSLVVGRETTARSMRKQANAALITIGASIDV